MVANKASNLAGRSGLAWPGFFSPRGHRKQQTPILSLPPQHTTITDRERREKRTAARTHTLCTNKPIRKESEEYGGAILPTTATTTCEHMRVLERKSWQIELRQITRVSFPFQRHWLICTTTRSYCQIQFRCLDWDFISLLQHSAKFWHGVPPDDSPHGFL